MNKILFYYGDVWGESVVYECIVMDVVDINICWFGVVSDFDDLIFIGMNYLNYIYYMIVCNMVWMFELEIYLSCIVDG